MAKKLKTIVMKFGGTSVATSEKIKMIAKHIIKYRKRGDRVVAVVSAMGKETDELIRLMKEVSDAPDAREYDQMIHTGEIKTAALLAMALKSLGENAKSYTGLQLGIVTNDNHGQSEIVRISTKEHLRKQSADHVMIVAGFQGIAEGSHEVTTLGRGGSDATAVAIAAAVSANACEIYTDVDGVYAIDPRLVKDAKRFQAINYEQMLSMAAAGAGVLMDRCVKIAQLHGIPLKVMLSPSFGKSDGGTTVANMGDITRMEREPCAAGIAIKKDLSVVNVTHIPNEPSYAAKIFETAKDVNIIDTVQGESGTRAAISMIVNEDDAHSIIKKLRNIKEIKVRNRVNTATLTLIDSMMKEGPEYMSRVTSVLGENGINIRVISTASTAISIAINKNDLEKAANVLAHEFELTV